VQNLFALAASFSAISADIAAVAVEAVAEPNLS
jgi:hypothetical protein